MQQEKNMTALTDNFNYRPEELAAFAYYFDAFTIQLKNGQLIRHRATDPNAFYEWLLANGVKVNNNNYRQEPVDTVAYLLTPPLS